MHRPNEEPIRFDSGANYERFMGQWSQSVGTEFLTWLSLPTALRWLDVGCGNGAFTELLVSRQAPSFVAGIDPSDDQLAYARARPPLRAADLRQGDAMALPFGDGRFDVAVMPLVLFFVPEPARGVAEMTRVVVPGGVVTAYAWDMEGGGFPYATLHAQMRDLGIPVPMPPHPEASRLDVLHDLWIGAGLEEIDACVITVERTFESFDDYWTTVRGGPSAAPGLRAATPDLLETLRERMRTLLPANTDGRISYSARAHAVRGRVPSALT
jgi:SAM-dependent methyltransferase